MRGGTSKGGLFLAEDLPADVAARDALLLRVMGSPDPRQIDGLGGAHPLTSKVGVVSRSDEPGIDVDYLFLQVVVDAPVVSTSQTCGNILAAVGPFAVERGLVLARDGVTEVRVRMVNNDGRATLHVRTPGGVVTYDGDTELAGVPGTAAPVEIDLQALTVPLLPTGHLTDELAGVTVTCIDNGMPSVIVRAGDLGCTGAESPDALESDVALVARIGRIRAEASAAMGLPSDLATSTVPKVVLVSPPEGGGTLQTRSFIPHRVHQAIGVLGAATVAAAAALPGTVAHELAAGPAPGRPLRIEHPTGFLDVAVASGNDTEDLTPSVARTTIVRTARMLMDGTVYAGPARAL
ncbi:4-oxalomesaconate tautomerase [Mumia sp. ZJ1417]|nr:4-oxalomesaconate tautomerase [Mumia sp. ZJ1417]